jgi:hypothetical protein
VIILTLVALAGIWWHGAGGRVRIVASNLAGLLPAGYMLVRFLFVYSDRLPLWAARMANLRFEISEAAGWARAWLG